MNGDYMYKVYKNICEIIGRTPIIELLDIKRKYDLKANLFAKLECFNPGGSSKDRVAKQMIDDALENGLIDSDTVIIEPTSGNTGIGLAMVGAVKGFRVIIVMPDSMSIERIQLIRAYGAEVVLTDGKFGMQGAIDKANDLKSEIPNSFIPSQFDNCSNPKAHQETTGKEIYEDMEGNVDIFVCGVGTGGTITGVGEYLKSKNKNIKVVAVEPFLSPVLSNGTNGKHNIQGIGAGFVPKILNTKIYDEVIAVKEEDAYAICNVLAKNEGLLLGISSGAAIFAAIEIASRKENENKNIVILCADSGERYLSTNIYS